MLFYIQNRVLVIPSLVVDVFRNALVVMVFVCFTPYESAEADAKTIESFYFVCYGTWPGSYGLFESVFDCVLDSVNIFV